MSTNWPLVERDREFRTIQAALRGETTGCGVVLTGDSGVGKTTLVENLLGSLTPTAGRVRVLGTDPRRAGADFWARVGLVQQSWTDHAKWRVRDQLEWIRSVQLTAASRVSGVEEVLDVRSVDAEDRRNSQRASMFDDDVGNGACHPRH